MNTQKKRAPRATPNQSSPAEELRGTIERVQFAADSGWSILRVKTDAGVVTTVRGTTFRAAAGERIHCLGSWTDHPQYGRQFDAKSIDTAPPASVDAIEKYLASGVIDGVGPHYARKLVKFFGPRLPHVLQNNPAYLEAVEGIGPERRRRISASWHKHANQRDIMMFLHEHGVGNLRAAQIHRRYGERAIATLRENPYRLAEDLRGVGFATADQIAGRLGISGEHEKRIEAGLNACMQRARLQGDCAVPQLELIQRAAKMLDVSQQAVESSLERLLTGRRLACDSFTGEPLIALPSLRAAEIAVVGHIRRLQRSPPPWSRTHLEQRIEAAEQRTGIALSATQFEAIRSLLEHKVAILTGGPGTGKTTITRVIVDLLSEQVAEIRLAAPTGKAARRLGQATGREATTLHRLLRCAPEAKGFGHDSDRPLVARLLLIDESPMIDLELARATLEALPDHAALILVGDVNQLPSVGPGQVVHDLIESGTVPVVRLTENRRQSDNSSVIRNAYRVNRGLMPISSGDPKDEFQWVIENDTNMISDRLINLVAQELPRRFSIDPMRDIQALAPMHRGLLGTRALNLRLQKELSPQPREKIVVGDAHFGLGDRLVQLTNYTDEGVFNGDTGHLVNINHTDKRFTIRFDDDLVVTYDFDQIDDIALANVMSVHKAQGSEYPVVVIAFASVHYPLLSKRLLYSAMTRGERVILVGDERAVHIALSSERSEIRRTGLQERLRRTP